VLQTFPELPLDFTYYRVKRHLLICNRISKGVIVVTIMHGSMDIPRRITELLPTLSEELVALRRRLSNDSET